MPKQTVLFTKVKDTKNTVKFDEVAEAGKPPIIGSLYVQKWVAGSATTAKVDIELK